MQGALHVGLYMHKHTIMKQPAIMRNALHMICEPTAGREHTAHKKRL